MSSAVFIVPFIEGLGPQIDMEVLTADGVEDGYGWSVIGHVPQGSVCAVVITASDAVLDTLADNADYLYVEDVDG